MLDLLQGTFHNFFETLAWAHECTPLANLSMFSSILTKVVPTNVLGMHIESLSSSLTIYLFFLI